MKFLFLAILLAGTQSFAAQTESTIKMPTEGASATNTVSTPRKTFLSAEETSKRIYLYTNFVDLTKGSGNLGIDFFMSEKFAMGFRGATGSAKEDVTKNGVKSKLSVDRTSYTLAGSIFFSGIDAPRTLVFSPGLAFGQKRDALDVDNQNGLSAKLTGLFKMKNELTFEAGVRGDNLDDGFKGDVYGGFGCLF